MKSMKLIGLVFAALVAFSAVSASAAFAETEFLFNAEPIGTMTQVPFLSETTEEGGLLLEDMKGGLFGEGVDILCSGGGEGFVEGPLLGFITKIFSLEGTESPPAFVKCVTDAGICPEPETQPVNLPWHFELDLSTGKVRALLLEEKLAGWKLLCSKGSVEDVCTAEAGVDTSLGLSNGGANDVLVKFDESVTAPAICDRGGAKQALINGTILFFGDTGSVSVDE
ncbi:MAG TPA: hypothetical protein VFW38_11440 [Solirubrobacteraceae bacterium]|nr:hypothetical protein [Solirubrobacteraceae bacterium]